jgi:predicted helicase
LSEGVDVPALDAVLFLSAKNSQVDVVQSVGRVMRNAPGKKYGWIIIPVLIPADAEPDKALNNNKEYSVVWTVLNALRAHDDRFNATVNKIDLNQKKPDNILIGRPEYAFDGENPVLTTGEKEAEYGSGQLALPFGQLQNVIYARMVEKVGTRRYWEQWAKDVADIAKRQIERITYLIKSRPEQEAAFASFLDGLQRSINPGIDKEQAVEMLAQHLVTGPVFEALFEGNSFVHSNIVSIAMHTMLEKLQDENLANDSETLQKFYDSVRKRAEGIDNAKGKQRIIDELYQKFFKTAFPKMAEQLGIVYTPEDAADFIIRSVDDVLQKEFGRCLSDENVHILDPFVGTGTFITRLLQSGLIRKEDLARKYKEEIHANEIVLLAYYIAAVNIENVWHDLAGQKEYTPFDSICLTDTFQMFENGGQQKLKGFFQENSERIDRQKKAPLRVIIGNPPYSAGQRSANDNSQNRKYERLDSRIAESYAKETKASNKNSLYDSYFRAFRWSSDRLNEHGHGGVIAFISNGGWLDGNSADGFRKCLEREFTSIYVFNLRGNARTQGELRRKEAGNLFGIGSRTPVTITVLVKNPEQKKSKAAVFYHDIGDYLTREQKLATIKKFRSVGSQNMPWQQLHPDKNGDWINKGNSVFDTFISIGDKANKDNKAVFFVPFYGRGIATCRDAWCYNSSKPKLDMNVESLLYFYNQQAKAFQEEKQKNPAIKIKKFLDYDPKVISWSDGLVRAAEKGTQHHFEDGEIVESLYRPFFKQRLYYSRVLNERVYQMPKIWPDASFMNKVICVSAPGGNKDLSAIICNCIPDLHFNGDTQCFPLYWYEKREAKQMNLFSSDSPEYICRDGVSDFILERARRQYGKNVAKEDIFYYVYGFLHSPEYRAAFANDLKKSLPRLPLVDAAQDFWAFSKAGRALAELHVRYEEVPPCPGVEISGAESGFFLVEKMRFPAKEQKETILFNSRVTLSGIPAKAYQYIVNGKSAIEWVMERYQVTVHKESGIANDPNDWADEVGKPRYILDLLLSVINLSVQTVEIVERLPKVRFEG